MNKIASLLFISICIFAGCSTLPELVSVESAYRHSFVPIDPLPSPMVDYYDDAGRMRTSPWSTFTNEAANRLLPLQSSQMTLEKLEVGGSIKVSSANVSAEKGTYRVTLDYMKYMIDNLPEGSEAHGQGWVGVGARITATINTTKANLDLGNLIAIGVNAKEENLSGWLKVDVIGMDSPEIIQLFPTPSTIDQTAIQKALEAIAAIKSKLGDAKTRLTPHVVAIKMSDTTTTSTQVRRSFLERPAVQERKMKMQ